MRGGRRRRQCGGQGEEAEGETRWKVSLLLTVELSGGCERLRGLSVTTLYEVFIVRSLSNHSPTGVKCVVERSAVLHREVGDGSP